MPAARFYYQDPRAPVPNAPLSIGVVALMDGENGLLLEQRRDSGQWGLIGGMVADETLMEALRREVREEAGLTVTTCRLFGTFSDPSLISAYPDGTVRRSITLAYVTEVADPTALRVSEESLALSFVTREALASLDIIAPHRLILDHYFAEPPVVLS